MILPFQISGKEKNVKIFGRISKSHEVFDMSKAHFKMFGLGWNFFLILFFIFFYLNQWRGTGWVEILKRYIFQKTIFNTLCYFPDNHLPIS